MIRHTLILCAALLITGRPTFAVGAAQSCDGPREVREATVASIKAFIQKQQMNVLSFTGYSGAEYENPAAMIEHATRVLEQHSPGKTLINIGATAVGIGAVYAIAKRKGFTTMGMVSTQACDERVTLSKRLVQFGEFLVRADHFLDTAILHFTPVERGPCRQGRRSPAREA